eukprot:TRINITY_DN2808_c0_g1_i2.p1 TRINITY_DN2808_c0_g1~~TRINITY_DN2808_c0_g1_i2.p1  ORF type:complete len:378 (-),score=105.58 TRINITY_DN2808_c0_g1_i2:217-1350(-)
MDKDKADAGAAPVVVTNTAAKLVSDWMSKVFAVDDNEDGTPELDDDDDEMEAPAFNDSRPARLGLGAHYTKKETLPEEDEATDKLLRKVKGHTQREEEVIAEPVTTNEPEDSRAVMITRRNPKANNVIELVRQQTAHKRRRTKKAAISTGEPAPSTESTKEEGKPTEEGKKNAAKATPATVKRTETTKEAKESAEGKGDKESIKAKQVPETAGDSNQQGKQGTTAATPSTTPKRKHTKTRSRQKNIRKDTRPPELRPQGPLPPRSAHRSSRPAAESAHPMDVDDTDASATANVTSQTTPQPVKKAKASPKPSAATVKPKPSSEDVHAEPQSHSPLPEWDQLYKADSQKAKQTTTTEVMNKYNNKTQELSCTEDANNM